NDTEAVAAVIEALKSWYRHIGVPVSLSDAGISALDLEACTTQALALSRLWGVAGYTEEDIRSIYRLMA
ncbi:MAG: hypothetical protein N3A02_08555, partial [Rectinema sp.]|nr:hypothetical protein [Rectinema sp.]